MKWILASVFAISSMTLVPAAEAKGVLSDTVKKVREDDDGVVVLFNKNAGSYYLRRDVTGFDGAKKKLQDSFNTKKPVGVTVDSSQLNILEVK